MNASIWQAFKQLMHLIRWPNLLIIVLSMYFVRHFIVLPIFDAVQLSSTLEPLYFFQMVLAVILIAGGGYIQNDLLDKENDKLNQSKRLTFQASISEKELESLYKIFFFIGNALGFYIAYKAGRFQLGFIFLFASMLLVLYNRIFKRQLLIGNIVVALLSALTLLLVLLFESTVVETNIPSFGNLLPLLYLQLLVYAGFAFSISLIREIVKDMEDLEGDKALGMQTLAIVAGIKGSKIILTLLFLLPIFATAYFANVYAQDAAYFQAGYILLAVVSPLIFTLFLCVKAQESKQFHRVGLLLKIIMLTGILSMPIFYLLI